MKGFCSLLALGLIASLALPTAQQAPPATATATPAPQTPAAGRGRGTVPVQGAEPDIALVDRFDKDGNKRLFADQRRAFLLAHSEVVKARGAVASAQAIPDSYQAVLTTLGKTGDFNNGVLKVNIPRNDVTVTIAGRPRSDTFWLRRVGRLCQGRSRHGRDDG